MFSLLTIHSKDTTVIQPFILLSRFGMVQKVLNFTF